MSTDTTIVKPTPPLFDEARLAVAGFLARYSDATRALRHRPARVLRLVRGARLEVYVAPVTAKKRPGAQDRLQAIRVALQGIASRADPLDVTPDLAALHPTDNTFPGEVLPALAADALDEAGASREQPVSYEGIRERYLPEIEIRGRVEHHKSHYALQAAWSPICSAKSSGVTVTTCGCGRSTPSSSTSESPPSAREGRWPPCATRSPPVMGSSSPPNRERSRARPIFSRAEVSASLSGPRSPSSSRVTPVPHPAENRA